jgi:hypothetical protein
VLDCIRIVADSVLQRDGDSSTLAPAIAQRTTVGEWPLSGTESARSLTRFGSIAVSRVDGKLDGTFWPLRIQPNSSPFRTSGGASWRRRWRATLPRTRETCHRLRGTRPRRSPISAIAPRIRSPKAIAKSPSSKLRLFHCSLDGSVWTSAGVTTGSDLALALIEEDCALRVRNTALSNSEKSIGC